MVDLNDLYDCELSQHTVSIDDVDDTRGESGLVYQAGELQRAEGGEFGGLGGCRVRRFGVLKGRQTFKTIVFPVASAGAILATTIIWSLRSLRGLGTVEERR